MTQHPWHHSLWQSFTNNPAVESMQNKVYCYLLMGQSKQKSSDNTTTNISQTSTSSSSNAVKTPTAASPPDRARISPPDGSSNPEIKFQHSLSDDGGKYKSYHVSLLKLKENDKNLHRIILNKQSKNQDRFVFFFPSHGKKPSFFLLCFSSFCFFFFLYPFLTRNSLGILLV